MGEGVNQDVAVVFVSPSLLFLVWVIFQLTLPYFLFMKREEARQLANSLEMTEMATLPPMTGKQLHSDEYTASPETSSSGVSYPPPSSYNQSPM